VTGALVFALLSSVIIGVLYARRYRRKMLEEQALLAQVLPMCRTRCTYRWDLDTGRVLRELSLLERLGYGAGACLLSTADWIALIVPEDRARLEDALAQVVAGRETGYLTTYTLRGVDGTLVRVIDRGVSESTADDGRVRQILGTLAVLDDASPSNVNGLRMQVTEGAAAVAPVPHQALFGPAGSLTIASAGLAPFVLHDGQTGAPLLGASTLHAATSEDAARLTELWAQAELRGRSRRRVTLLTAAGQGRLMDLSLVRVNMSASRAEMLLQARELSQAHLVEPGRHDATRSELVTHVARRAAHDISSPLGALRNVAELLRRAGDDRPSRERYITLIDRAVDQIAAVNRELARAAEWEQAEVAGANLAHVLEDVVREFRGELTLRTDAMLIPQDARVLAIPDPALRVVARSLLRGVFASTVGEGSVHVLATRVDDDVVIRIEADAGGRIARTGESGAASSFMHDADNARRVSIASEVLGMFDASLSVHGVPGGGTLFELRCPAAVPASVARDVADATLSLVPDSGERRDRTILPA